MSKPHRRIDPLELLRRARAGDGLALGELLQSYRPYLALLARLKSDHRLQSKLSNSDLVQDTCLSAHRDFADFRGTTEPELTAWLREIMAHVCANHARDHRRQRRDVRLERQLYTLLDHSSAVLERALANSDSDPDRHILQRERAVILASALDRLPSDYREVLVSRELEGKSLAEIAQQIGKTSNAVQKIWARALIELRRTMRTTLDSP